MCAKKVSDILADLADERNTPRAGLPEEYLAAHPEGREELTSLFNIAARAKQTLEPVSPTPEFRTRLHDGLLLVAQHRDSGDLSSEQDDLPWGWLIMMAVLAGLFVLVLRSRQIRRDLNRNG